MRETYITKETIEQLGFRYFDGWDFDNHFFYEEGQIYSTANGLLVKCEDRNIFIRYYYGLDDLDERMESGWDDEVYYDLDDIHLKAYIDAREKFFNMKAICDAAGVSYQVYKNYKYNGYNGLSNEKLQCIVNQMKKVCQ